MQFQIWGMRDDAVLYENALVVVRAHRVNAYLRVNWGWQVPVKFYSLN